MRAYMETLFYVIYLVLMPMAGIYLILKRKKGNGWLLFGLAMVILAFGDAFHLVPRAVGLFTKTLDNPSSTLAMWLGLGKLITSITMTVFYVLFYLFIYKRTGIKRNPTLDVVVGVLFGMRIVLCAFPQNRWLSNGSDPFWGVLRNIPFTALGIIVIVLAFKHLRTQKPYGLLFLAIILSFGFYLPVVVFAGTYSWVGMLMLPKTICYLWIAFLGFLDAKKGRDAEATQE